MSSSLSVGTVSSGSFLIPNVRFKKPRPKLPQYESSDSSFESQRCAQIIRNEEMRALLVPDCVVQPKTKLPVFSKKVKRIPARIQPVRATKSTMTPHRPKPLKISTVSKKGSWICVKACDVVSPTIEVFLTHLKDSHALPFEAQFLAPLGLALCPYCNGVFAAFRGLANHMRSCTYPHVSVSEKETGPFPKICFVWWPGESCWYERHPQVSRHGW